MVTDPLPTGLTYVSAAGDGWACAQPDGTVTCTLAGDVAVGADAPEIVLTVGPSARRPIPG